MYDCVYNHDPSRQPQKEHTRGKLTVTVTGFSFLCSLTSRYIQTIALTIMYESAIFNLALILGKLIFFFKLLEMFGGAGNSVVVVF